MVTLEVKQLTDDLLENTIRDVVVKDVLYKLKEPVLWAIRNDYSTTDVQNHAEVTPDEMSRERRARVAVESASIPEESDREAEEAQGCDREGRNGTPPGRQVGRRTQVGLGDWARVQEYGRLGRTQGHGPRTFVAVEAAVKPVAEEGELARKKLDDGACERRRSAGAMDKPSEDEQTTSGGREPGLPPIGYAVSGPNPAGETTSELIQILGPVYLAKLADEIKASVSENESTTDSAVFSWLNTAIRDLLPLHAAVDLRGRQVHPSRSLGLRHRLPVHLRGDRANRQAPALPRLRDAVRVRNEFLARLYFRRSKLPYFNEKRYGSGLEADSKECRILIDRVLIERVRAADLLCYMVLAQLDLR